MTTRVFDKGTLLSVNRMAQVQGYNRVCDVAFLENLPADQFYVPFITLLHEHKAGKPCDPHVRCVFRHNGGMFSIDVEMGCWDLLPTVDSMLERVKPQTTTTQEAASAE